MQYYYIEQTEELESTLRHEGKLQQTGTREAKEMNNMEQAFTDWFNTDANPTNMKGISDYKMPDGETAIEDVMKRPSGTGGTPEDTGTGSGDDDDEPEEDTPLEAAKKMRRKPVQSSRRSWTTLKN